MSEDILDELDEEQKEKIEEARMKIKEQRYFKSLRLIDLGTELHRAEKFIRENRNESRLEKTKEYKDKVKKEINSRMEAITEHEKEME